MTRRHGDQVLVISVPPLVNPNSLPVLPHLGDKPKMFNLLYWWNHRKDSPAQRKLNLRIAKHDLLMALRGVQKTLTELPASKEVHDAYNKIDSLCNELESDCQG